MTCSTDDPRRHIPNVLCDADLQTLLRVGSLCDGHTIFQPERLTGAGLAEGVVAYLHRTHHSESDTKSTIFVDGRAVKAVQGIYGLDVLRLIADALELKITSKFGRGSQAAAIQAALRDKLEPRSITQSDPSTRTPSDSPQEPQHSAPQATSPKTVTSGNGDNHA